MESKSLRDYTNDELIREIERRVSEDEIEISVSINPVATDKKIQEGWDKLDQQQEELDNAMKDLENTRSRVMDNIAKRHAAFHEEMERLKKQSSDNIEEVKKQSEERLRTMFNDM